MGGSEPDKHPNQLWLGNVYCLADHHATMHDKKQHNRMELEGRALRNNTQGKILEYPTLRNPVCHKRSDRQRRRNRCAFEILRLASLVLGQHCDGHVEPSQACQPAKHKESQEQVVGRSASSECECCGSGCEAKGDLGRRKEQEVSQRNGDQRRKRIIPDQPTSQAPVPSKTTSSSTLQSFHP